MNAHDYNTREIEAGRFTAKQMACLVVEVGGDLEAAVRRFQADRGLAVDGKAGPATRDAINRFFRLWEPTVDPIPNGWAEVFKVYGDPKAKNDPSDPRKLIVSPAWESKHCKGVSASLIAGYDRPIYMNRAAVQHFLEAMRRSRAAAPDYRFRKIGCFNPRHKRFDPKAEMSIHTVAAAFDLNDDMNKWAPAGLKPFEPGWSRYSDLPQEVVEAWESVGFVWLGRVNGDTMHMQLARGV